jgi:hypothetical protein
LSDTALTWYMRLDNTKVKKMEGFSWCLYEAI